MILAVRRDSKKFRRHSWVVGLPAQPAPDGGLSGHSRLVTVERLAWQTSVERRWGNLSNQNRRHTKSPYTMKRLVFAVAAIVAAAVGSTQTASANSPMGFPFFPFGFYQPYGAAYGTSLPTPPYFALNPPVYYGARHARPYGISPFASPPVVQPGGDYRSRLRTDFHLPPSEYDMPARSCNPCVHQASRPAAVEIGQVQTNPFFAEPRVASNELN